MKSLHTILLFCLAHIAFGQANHEQLNKRIALGVFEAFNEHDWEKMASYYHDNVILEDPSQNAPIIGSDGIPAKYAGYAEYIPDIQDSVMHLYSFEEHVVIEFVSYGTTIKGQPFRLPICTIMTIEDGKISRDANYYDLKN